MMIDYIGSFYSQKHTEDTLIRGIDSLLGSYKDLQVRSFPVYIDPLYWDKLRRGASLFKLLSESDGIYLLGSVKVEVYSLPPGIRIANFVYNNLSQEYEATKNLENFVKIIQDTLIFHIYATSDDDPNDLENIRCVLYNNKGDKYEATKIKAYDLEYKSSKYSSYYRRSWYVNFNLFDDSGMPIIVKEAKSFKLVVILGIRRAELTWDLTDLSK